MKILKKYFIDGQKEGVKKYTKGLFRMCFISLFLDLQQRVLGAKDIFGLSIFHGLVVGYVGMVKGTVFVTPSTHTILNIVMNLGVRITI